MTKPVTGLTISIGDDAKIILAAADAEAEGHLWAIERREISWDQLRQVAAILGPDAERGVEARFEMLLARQRQLVAVQEARLKELELAREVLEKLEELVPKLVGKDT